jgi:hypothetical protein
MDFVQNVQNGKTRVLTFGNEYAKMQPLSGFIVMASFLFSPALRFDYVHLRGSALSGVAIILRKAGNLAYSLMVSVLM